MTACAILLVGLVLSGGLAFWVDRSNQKRYLRKRQEIAEGFGRFTQEYRKMEDWEKGSRSNPFI